MSTNTFEMELPIVAHMVADLDAIEAEEATLATYRAAPVSAPRYVAGRKPSYSASAARVSRVSQRAINSFRRASVEARRAFASVTAPPSRRTAGSASDR